MKDKLIIKVDDTKVSTGHQEHITGTGPHVNKPKRKRTRQAANDSAIKDSRDV